MNKLAYFARRAREPSTWAAISVVLALVGVPAPVAALAGSLLDVAPHLIDVLAAIGAASVAAALPEKGRDA